MSSIESDQLGVLQRVNEENFILAEYVKRNFEQYADNNDVQWVIENWNYPVINKDEELYKIQNIIRHFFIQSEKIKNNNLKTIEFFDFNDFFDRKKLEEWIENAYMFSVKYGLSVSDILFPYDMECIVKMIVENNTNFYPTIFFNNTIQENSRGCVSNYDDKTKMLSFHINLNDDLLDVENIVTAISMSMTLLRCQLGYSVSNFEKNMMNKAATLDNSGNYRSSQILAYSRSVGLFAWDMKKIKKWSIEDIMTYLHNNNLILKKDKNRLKYNICKKVCKECNELESCKKFFAESYRFASLSIRDNRIVPTSAQGSVKNLVFSNKTFDRVEYK